MLELIGYIFLAGLFVLEISLLRMFFARQSTKELNTFIEGWDSIKEQYETVNPKEPKVVVNKVSQRIKD